MVRPPRRPSLAALALLLLLLLQSLAGAQTWVGFDGSPDGTPAEIVLDELASTPEQTTFDVVLHGLWLDDVKPGDGFTYQRVTVPGLDRLGQVGAPDLGVARLRLAVSTDASLVALQSAVVLGSHALALLPYPYETQQLDEASEPGEPDGPGDPDGVPAVFHKDAGIYGGTASFPPTTARTTALVRPWIDSVPFGDVEIRPLRWDAATGVLTVDTHLRVTYSATGTPQAFPTMTADRSRFAAATFFNWSEQEPSFPVETNGFSGRYLVVTPQKYVPLLTDYTTYLLGDGFDVTLLELESIAVPDCAGIRAAIDDWYDSGSPWDDHYALLVGDVDAIPMCASPTLPSVPGDDLYGSPSDGDLEEEVFVGRLSVDDGADLARQLAKILGYRTNTTAQHFDEALLVAHVDGAPGKYEAAQESVRTASYAVAPSFERRYGSQAGSTDANVRASIASGVGLLSYRGHGTETSWPDWNVAGDSFHKNDVLLLTNSANPLVVWSLACWTSRLDHAGGSVDSLGETWMEKPQAGAVAHYGHTAQVATAHEDELDRRLFEAVYDRGLQRHGMAIAWAEWRAARAEPALAPWSGLLLGDASMKVRRTDPEPLTLIVDDPIPACSQCTVTVRVEQGGQPAAGVLVTLVQPGPLGAPPLFAAEAITNGSGQAIFPMGPGSIQSPIHVQGSDPFGNEATVDVGSAGALWVNAGGALVGGQGKPQVVGDGPLTGGSLTTLDLTHANENAPAALFLAAGSTPVPFKCGTLKAFPFFALVNLVTDAQGEIPLAFPWPPGIPADTEVWFQYAIQDPMAVCGVALTNAMVANTP